MVERQRRSDMPRSLKPRASGAMTDAVVLATAHRRKSRHDTALRAPGRHRRRWHAKEAGTTDLKAALFWMASNQMAASGPILG